MLSDILPPEQVQAIVTEFKRRLDTTTDYIALHDELYNYRMRLIDQAQRGPIWSNTYTNNPN
jgi:hypothetical protein